MKIKSEGISRNFMVCNQYKIDKNAALRQSMKMKSRQAQTCKNNFSSYIWNAELSDSDNFVDEI